MSDLRAGDRVRTDLGDEGTVVEIKRNAARVAVNRRKFGERLAPGAVFYEAWFLVSDLRRLWGDPR